MERAVSSSVDILLIIYRGPQIKYLDSQTLKFREDLVIKRKKKSIKLIFILMRLVKIKNVLFLSMFFPHLATEWKHKIWKVFNMWSAGTN